MSTIQLEKQQVPDGGGGSAEDVEKALQVAQEAAESAQDASTSAKNAEDRVDELSNELNESLTKIDEAYTKADNAEQLANGLDGKINSEKDERIADIANVKELIAAEEEARKAGDKANSDAIEVVKTDVANNALSIEQNTQGIASVNQAVSNLSSSTENFINSTNTKLDTTVQLDTSVTGNDSTVTISKVTGKLGGESTSTEMALPVASEDKAGVINPATYKQIQDASEKIETILVSSVLVNNLPENPTDEQLTSAWKENTGKDTLINGAKVTGGDGKTYTYYSNINSWKESAAGGGKLYNKYSTATDGANTAAFIKEVLQGSNVILGNAAVSDNIAIGEGAKSGGAGRIAIGTNAEARGVYSHAIGDGSIAVGVESLTVGYNTDTTGSGASAIGSSSIAQESGTSVGYCAKSGINCVAIGHRADNSEYTDSVALGSSAKNTRNNEFIVGAVPTIHANIKAGELDTDAVNLAQLNAVSETANDAKAMASAASSAATAAASAATTVDGRVDGVVTEVNTIKQDYMKTENYHIMTVEEFKAAWDAA